MAVTLETALLLQDHHNFPRDKIPKVMLVRVLCLAHWFVCHCTHYVFSRFCFYQYMQIQFGIISA